MRWPNNDFCFILADSITIAQEVLQYVFTARCYAWACVHLSQVGVLSKRLNESSWWFLARQLPSTHPTLCYREIRFTSKIRVLPSGTLFQTPDLKNFALVY